MNFLDILFRRIEGFFKSMLSRVTAKLSKIRQLPVTAAKKAKDILRGMVTFIIKKPSELCDYVKLGNTYVAKRALLGVLLLIAAAVLLVIWLLVPFLQRTLFARKLTVNTAEFFAAEGSAEVYTEYGTLLYRGNITKGAAQGSGKLYDNGEMVYLGDFADNEYNGSGKLYSDGVLIYDGGFEASLYSGSGKLYDSDGVLIYSGDFAGGLYDGEGTEYFPDGSVSRRGTFTAGVLNGEGQLYADGGKLIYSGGFVNGIYSGSGELYEDGVLKYVGSFVDGAMSGEGTEYSPDGSKVYSGGFSAGVYSGSGKLYAYKDGMTIEGQFENGAANGVCSIYRSSGEQIFSGSVINGEINWFSLISLERSAVAAAFPTASGERDIDGRTLVFCADLNVGFIFGADGKPDRMVLSGSNAFDNLDSFVPLGAEPYSAYVCETTAADRQLMRYIGVEPSDSMVCRKYISSGMFVKTISIMGSLEYMEIGMI